VTSYSYDDVGNLASVTTANGVQHAYTYNTLNRLTNVGVTKTGTTPTPINNYAYQLGAAGNRLSVTETSGRKATYTYDELYRLTSETITGDLSPTLNGVISYSYDAVGNRLSRTSTVAGVPSVASQQYDVNDRLTSDGYDANGNTTASNGNGYVYDFENRLLKVNAGTANEIAIVYDGDGNRVSKTLGGVTTKYLVDTNNPTGYAQVVEELSVVGSQLSVIRQYTYGHDLISQRQLIAGNWQTSWYQYDGHGSVRSLTNSAGSVTDTFTYDAFGVLIARTGTTPNLYLYAGEQYDPDLMLYYNRARYLKAETGRFWTQDSYEGDLNEPLSLHKYLYANNNVVNKVDPSGYIATVAEIGISVNLLKTIAVIAVFAAPFILEKIKDELDKINTNIYRETSSPNSPKSVALRREKDWRTGLSFSAIKPKVPHLTYRVKTLLTAGFVIKPDGKEFSVDVHTLQPLPEFDLRQPGHVSVWFVSLDVWDAWYKEEEALKGTPIYSPMTLFLHSLRERK
jgi:RHS repeat-associated protein